MILQSALRECHEYSSIIRRWSYIKLTIANGNFAEQSRELSSNRSRWSPRSRTLWPIATIPEHLHYTGVVKNKNRDAYADEWALFRGNSSSQIGSIQSGRLEECGQYLNVWNFLACMYDSSCKDYLGLKQSNRDQPNRPVRYSLRAPFNLLLFGAARSSLHSQNENTFNPHMLSKISFVIYIYI